MPLSMSVVSGALILSSLVFAVGDTGAVPWPTVWSAVNSIPGVGVSVMIVVQASSRA